MADAARNHEKISILTNTVVVELSGDTSPRCIRICNMKTGQETEHQAAEGETFGVFVFASYSPSTDLARGVAELDEQGYILTDRSQKTTADGLYAAGDVCVKPLRQVVTAVGDGALAATQLELLCAAMPAKTGIRPQQPAARSTAPEPVSGSSELISEEIAAQLRTLFDRMSSSLILRLFLDQTPVSRELSGYMEELTNHTDKLTVELAEPSGAEHLPCVQVCREDGSWTGLAFHGVPGGHEFTSFVLGLYNAAIQALQKPVKLQVLVSLSCTMCPELVTASQRLAAAHSQVTAQVYDLNHFPDLREKYQVMSVPCLVVNDGEQILFGKKNLPQLLELLNS